MKIYDSIEQIQKLSGIKNWNMKAGIYLFFFLCLSTLNYGQVIRKNNFSKDCDSSRVYTLKDRPIPSLSMIDIKKMLQENISIQGINKEMNDKFLYAQLIDCTGKCIKFIICKSSNPKLDSGLINCIYNNISWSPGHENSSPVNALIYWNIEIKNGKLKIIGDF
jgi:hypothetical protein